MQKLCPNCNQALKRKRMGFADSCLSTIAIEFVFWFVAGILSLILYKINNSAVIFVLAFIIIIIGAHLLEAKYATYNCIPCKKEFKKSELNE